MRIRDFSLSFRKQLNTSEVNQNDTGATQNQAQGTESVRLQQAATRSDAVVLSSSVNSKIAEPDGELQRKEKVESIKKQVKDGSYKVEREGVAVALIRDLGL